MSDCFKWGLDRHSISISMLANRKKSYSVNLLVSYCIKLLVSLLRPQRAQEPGIVELRIYLETFKRIVLPCAVRSALQQYRWLI